MLGREVSAIDHRRGTLVGVLTSERDGDYERGRELIERGVGGP